MQLTPTIAVHMSLALTAVTIGPVAQAFAADGG